MAKKILIAALLLAAIVVGGTGCMINRILNAGNTQAVNQQALAYMEEKYGETFTYSASYGNSMSGTREFLVTCDSLPGKQILVQVENFRSNDRVFRDNYLAVKYQDATISLFRGCFSDSYPDVNVFYEPTKQPQSAELSADAGFEDFLADWDNEMIVMIELKASEFTGTAPMDEIAEKIAQSCKLATLTVVVVEDDVFGTLDRSGLNDCIFNKEYVARAKVYIENGGVSIDWSGEGVSNG